MSCAARPTTIDDDHGQASHSRWPPAARRGADCRCEERRAARADRGAADRRAGAAGQRAAAAGRGHDVEAAAQHGRGGRPLARRPRRGHARRLGAHRARGALRTGEDDAGVDPGARAAAGAPGPRQGVAARRLRDRLAAGRPAHQGPAGDGRRDRRRARLYRGPCPASERRTHHHRHGHRHRHREPADGRHAGRRRDAARERRAGARGDRPGRTADRDGCADRRPRHQPHPRARRRCAACTARRPPHHSRSHRDRDFPVRGGGGRRRRDVAPHAGRSSRRADRQAARGWRADRCR